LSSIDGGAYITFALLAVIAWTVLWTQHWDKDVWRQFRARLRSVNATPTHTVSEQAATVVRRAKHAAAPAPTKHPLKTTTKPVKKSVSKKKR
jgi:type II secretory pathway component PulM